MGVETVVLTLIILCIFGIRFAETLERIARM